MNTNLKNIIISLLAFTILFSCNSDEKNSCKVKKGEFLASITETGELQAVRSKPIFMPYIGSKYGWDYKITWLADHGAKVKAGDIVAKVDNSSVMKYLYNQKDRLEVETANLNRLIASNESKITGLRSQLQSEEANYDLIKLQIDKYKFETANKVKVKKKELERAEINLARVKRQQELQKKIIENETRIQQIRIEQIQDNIREAEIALKRLEITSPIDGIMQLTMNRRANQFLKIGDEVSMGSVIAKVPDLNQMKVFSTVNEEDISKIAVNQDVITRLDAFPDKAFKGKIIYIGKLSYQKDWNSSIKVFDIEVQLSETDQSLKPGMTVSCEIIFAKYKDQFFIENECIAKENGNYYLIPEKSEKDKIKIKTGASNNKFTVVYGNLKKGLKVKPVFQEETKKEL
jgi:multidrug efflux pump subunit AcrA (membrane-fusion protein)